VADQVGAMEDVVVFHNHEDGCREHCHQPDSKHFAHLVAGRRVVAFAGDYRLETSLLHHSNQRSPPRPWCARKNSAEPAVATASGRRRDLERSVAAATIWAKR
jgi:hypothetical protein